MTLVARTADIHATRLAAARKWLAAEGHVTDDEMRRAAAKELARPRDDLHRRWAECVLAERRK